MPVANIKSSWKSGDLVFEKYLATDNPQIEFGVDATGLDVKFYGDTASVSMLWDESADKLTMTSAPIESTLTTGTTGKNAFKVTNVFSLATAGVHKAIQADVTYTPATTGFATSIGLAGKVALAASNSFIGGTGYMWGVQGQMDFGSSSVVNNAGSIFAAVRAVVTSTATPTFTEAEGIACVYGDNLSTTAMTGLSTGFSSIFFGNNSGAAIDTFLYLRGNNAVNSFVRFEDTAGTSGMITPTATTSGNSFKIAVYYDGNKYFMNMYAG